MSRGRDSLLLFARSPLPGTVKTRLREEMSPEETMALHRAMVRDAAGLVRRFSSADGVLCWSEPLPAGDTLVEAETGLEVMVQEGDDLGERLVRAFQARFARGDRRVVVIGSDSPTLTAEDVRRGFAALDDHDMVVGPAADGGYVLIGCSHLHVRPFQRIPWGTDRVLAETRRRLRREKIPHAVLPPGHDVDTWDDLLRTHGELEHLEAVGAAHSAPHTLAALREIVAGRVG